MLFISQLLVARVAADQHHHYWLSILSGCLLHYVSRSSRTQEYIQCRFHKHILFYSYYSYTLKALLSEDLHGTYES